MELNKEKFLKSEFGGELECVITSWDIALQKTDMKQVHLEILHGVRHNGKFIKWQLSIFMELSITSLEQMNITDYVLKTSRIG